MYDNWASDPNVTRHLTWLAHSSPAVTDTVLQQWIAGYDKPDFYQWAIVLKAIGAPIGSISVIAISEQVQKAEVGYCIGASWWRQGVMTEALRAVIDFLLGEVGLLRVEARHDTDNPHSGAVMQKCGMRFEGTLRQADRNNQGICDISVYGILAADRTPEEKCHSEKRPRT